MQTEAHCRRWSPPSAGSVLLQDEDGLQIYSFIKCLETRLKNVKFYMKKLRKTHIDKTKTLTKHIDLGKNPAPVIL